MAKRESPAETLKRFEGVSCVVADDLHFKRKLAIGEDAYTSIRSGTSAVSLRPALPLLLRRSWPAPSSDPPDLWRLSDLALWP
jgi:hypothetical protein